MTTQTQKTSIYAVRTTSGQERTVVDMMASRSAKKLPISAILAPEVIKGYIFVEASGPHFVVEVVGGPFRGLKAKITHVDKVKQEVVIELLEEGFATLPITVHADYVKLVG